jgi:tryptophan synthase beta chain
MDTVKYFLPEDRMPTAWYNIQADLPEPLPPVRHPGTGQPIGPDDLAPLFPMALIQQEVSQERWIDIPDEVQSILRQWRPTPLYRARRLEKALDTPLAFTTSTKASAPPAATSPIPPWPRPTTTSRLG